MTTIIYKASSGNQYNLQTDGSWIREANFHAWSFTPRGTELQFGQRVSSFAKEAATYTTTLIFHGTIQERSQRINKLHEEFENDIRNLSQARLFWGNWYIDCYIVASSTTPETVSWTSNEIEVFCPRPFWIKEEKKSFMAQDEPPAQQTFLDYEFDYEYDYFLGAIGSENWVREFPFDSDFKMYVYGPVSNPSISINGYPYQVFVTLNTSEYMIIDSMNNTVTKYASNGTKTSIFDLRNKAKSVFQKIPGGNLSFSWTGLFGFDLIIFNERSEPLNEEITTVWDTANISWNNSILMIS